VTTSRKGRPAKTLQREATPEMAGLLQQRLTAETDGAVKSQLEVALARLQLVSPQRQRLAAVELLGHSGDPETQALLTLYRCPA
jgi:urea transport system permease protein